MTAIAMVTVAKKKNLIVNEIINYRARSFMNKPFVGSLSFLSM